MALQIRQESIKDRKDVQKVILAAFLNAEHSDGTEHELVARLRQSDNFITELSLVAELDGEIVGHIILTPIKIEDSNGKHHRSLALAPVSVDPKFQKQGIGRELIQRSHEKATSLGFSSIVLLGHPGYYPKFGYKKASDFNITAPFDVPDDAFMVIELADGSLTSVSGTVKYPEPFGI